MATHDPNRSTDAHLIAADAAARAVRRDHLRLHRGVYTAPSSRLSPIDRIRAATMRAGDGAVVAGLSAAILHGSQFIDPDSEVELIRDLDGQGRTRGSVRVIRTGQLGPDDVQIIDGMAVTTPVRTAYDLGRRRPDWLALARLDDLVHATGLDLAELWAYAREHPRTHGVPQVRELIAFIDPKSESPGESWLRLCIVRHRLPMPESQIEVKNSQGRVIARFDLGYRRYKVGIDYDGVDFHTSDEQRAHDACRDRGATERGWEAIRVAAEPLSRDTGAVMTTIENAMTLRGYRPTE